MFTQQELKRQLHYNPETGVFTWLVSNNNRIRVGDKAGAVSSGKSYCRIKINGKSYGAHRLAFFYMHGEFPLKDVDHVDGNGLNNKWLNLRQVTHQENQKNQRLRKDNTS